MQLYSSAVLDIECKIVKRFVRNGDSGFEGVVKMSDTESLLLRAKLDFSSNADEVLELPIQRRLKLRGTVEPVTGLYSKGKLGIVVMFQA